MLKKFGTSILIVFILAGILSPYVLGVGNQIYTKLEKRTVYADDNDKLSTFFDISIITSDIKKQSAKLTLTIKEKKPGNLYIYGYEHIMVYLQKKEQFNTNDYSYYKMIFIKDQNFNPSATTENIIAPFIWKAEVLEPGATYRIAVARQTKYGDGDLEIINGQDFATLPGESESQETKTDSSYTPPVNSGGSQMPPCGLGIIGDNRGTISGCIAQGLYYAVFVPTSWLIIGAGFLLDFALAYSIDSNSYSGTSFVSEGWKLVRDISNILFILILIYTGIMVMFNMDKDAKKKIFTIVIVAILINFSLFFSKVIIDTGNIIAKTLYFNIQPTNSDGSPYTTTTNFGTTKAKPLSAILIGKFNPQQIILNANNDTVTKTGLDANGSITAGAEVKKAELGIGAFILIVLLSITLNVVGAYVFFTVAFLFITRVIGLWFMMIFSPLAFISYTLPNKLGGKLGSFGHDKWWSELAGLSFLAPVFIFFMYLIALFLDTDFLKINTGTTAEGMMFLMSIIIPFVFIAILLIKAKDIAKDMSGEIGKQMVAVAEKAGGYVTGAAVGVATGGAALLGRATLGAAGSRIAENDKLKEMEAKGGIRGFGARMALKTGSFLDKSSYDARSTMLGKTAEKAGFTASPKGLGLLNLDEKSGVGGHKKVKEDKVKKYEDRMKYLEISDNEYDKKKDKAKSSAVLKAVKANGGNPLDDATKEKVEKDAVSELGTKNDLNMKRKGVYANTLRESTPFVTAVGHTVSLGTIDKSAQRTVASKFGREVAGHESKKKDIEKELQKLEGDGTDTNKGKIIESQDKINKIAKDQEEIKKSIDKITETNGKQDEVKKSITKTNDILKGIKSEFDKLETLHGKGNPKENGKAEILVKQNLINNLSSDIQILQSQAVSDPNNPKIRDEIQTKLMEKGIRENERDTIKELFENEEKANKQLGTLNDKLESYDKQVKDLNNSNETLEHRKEDLEKSKKEYEEKVKELKSKLKGGGESQPKTP